jgi:hypothetical protein
MCPSFARIHLPFAETLERFASWRGVALPSQLPASDSVRAVSLACTPNGEWAGDAVFVGTSEGWTVIQDLSGSLENIPAVEWKRFAKSNELIFARYNDTMPNAEVVAIREGDILRDFRYWAEESPDNRNIGRLESECEPFATWIDVASFLDGADDKIYVDQGYVWVYRYAA